MGPAGTCEAGPAAYSGYMEVGVQLLTVGGGPVLTVSTWERGPVAYSGYMGQELPSGT